MWICQFLPSVWLMSEEGRGRGRAIPPEPSSLTFIKKLVPCDNLEALGGEEDEREIQEGGDILYLWLIHVNIWQKPTQYCKAIILQLKEIFFFKEAHLKPLLTSYLLTFHWPKQVIQPSPIWMGKKVVQPTAGGFWVEESTGLYVKKITSRADRSSVV